MERVFHNPRPDPKRMMEKSVKIIIDKAKFSQRSDRARYIKEHFRALLTGSILDVGCDQAYLRDLLPDSSYTGIDVRGRADIQLNMEQVNRLPFDDSAFDSVICADVLEHLDNLYCIFGELVRVCRKYLIISLPNNWCAARRKIERGYGKIAHYGLPSQPPQDRHKWFFGLTEARDFFEAQDRYYPISLCQLRATEKPRSFLLTSILHLCYLSEEHYLNRYAHTLWAVFEKRYE